jgi:alkylhydroperoxidase/carboxymuconolactone decarboxylase family protein YurZ
MGVTDEQIAEVLRITYFTKGNSVMTIKHDHKLRQAFDINGLPYSFIRFIDRVL